VAGPAHRGAGRLRRRRHRGGRAPRPLAPSAQVFRAAEVHSSDGSRSMPRRPGGRSATSWSTSRRRRGWRGRLRA
jgi:hypothetical protein